MSTNITAAVQATNSGDWITYEAVCDKCSDEELDLLAKGKIAETSYPIPKYPQYDSSPSVYTDNVDYPLKNRATFVHKQTVASSDWVIQHNFGKLPSSMVIRDFDGMDIGCAEVWQSHDRNRTTLRFNNPHIYGTAWLYFD